MGRLRRILHSKDTLFFPATGAERTEWAEEPRLIVCATSRENKLDSFAYGNTVYGDNAFVC